MHPHLFLTLRAIHVLSGALWVGTAVYSAMFLVPAIMATGPAGGQVMRVIAQVRKFPAFINSVMGTTILTGLALYWVDSAGFQASWIGSRAGLAFTIGAVLGLITAGVAQFVAVPKVKRLGQLGAAIAATGGPPTPEQAKDMAALQQALLRGTRTGATLLVITVILMSVARYL
jgi:uncharacterized membrane protein